MCFLPKKLLVLSIIPFMLMNSCEAKIISGKAMLAVDTKQTKADMEQIALAYAKREALESAAVYIDSVTKTHMSVVKHDTVSTFVKGMAKLKPETVKKRYEKAANGEEILYLQADFDIDEKGVEDKIRRYQYDKSIIEQYQHDVARFESLLLKYDYLTRKQKYNNDNQYENVLSQDLKEAIVTKLASGNDSNLLEVLSLAVGFLENGRNKELIAVLDLLIPALLKDNASGRTDDKAISYVYRLKAQALYELGRYDEMDATIEESFKYNPYDYGSLILKLDYLERANQAEKKMPYLKRLTVADPVSGNHQLAVFYVEKKEYSLAHQAIDIGITEEEKSGYENNNVRLAQLYSAKGKIFKEQNNLNEADKYMTKAISMSPTDPMLFLSRGALYELMNKYSEAIEDFTKSIELINNSSLVSVDRAHRTEYLAGSYFNRAVIYSNLEKWQDCLNDVNKALELYPDNSAAYILKKLAESKLK